ncbi:MAG: SHD1 domain-containing protein [Planctomycetaceae bacterium]
MSRIVFLCVAFVPICLMVGTATAQQLRYQIKPDQVVAYKVTITAATPASTDTMQGVISFKGLQTQGETLTLQYSGGLKKTSRSNSGGSGSFGAGRGGFGDFPRSPFDQPDFRGLVQSTNTIVMSDLGTVKNLRGDSQLPYLLGNLCLIPFEPLPDDDSKEWQEENGLTITSASRSNSRFGPRFGPFAENNVEEKKTGGGETVAYRIESENEGKVTITKTYTLSSPSATANDTGLAMQGSGSYVFNRVEGIPESMEMTLNLSVTSNSSEIKIPVTVAFTRMNDEDLAAHLQKVEEEKARAHAFATRFSRPIPPEDLKRVIGNLTSGDEARILRELKELSRSSRKEILKEDIALPVQIGLLLSHKNPTIQSAAQILWDRWGTAVEKHASEEDKKQVADSIKLHEEMASNPFEVEDADSGKGIRTWSDKSGRFKVDGEFQQLQGGLVVLKDKDGKTIRVPKARLSDFDQAIIEKLSGK